MNPTTTRSEDFDLLVIGGGSGGVRAARMAAQRGARVAIAESGAWGGTCVNVGCIPKKLYSYAAHYAHGFEESAGFGWQGTAPRLDWAILKARRAQEILRLNGIYQNLLAQAGVTLLAGIAQVTGPHSAIVNGQPVTASHLLIATGGQPVVPDIPGGQWALTSDQIFDVEPFPQRLVVVGGGYIACEFASIFQGLGSKVTQLHRGDALLRGFDDDVRHFLGAEMRKTGIDLRLGTQVTSLHRDGGSLKVHMDDGQTLDADAVLFATGRTPRAAGLGLQAVGVELDAHGAVVVDDHYQTRVPSIHALGDVTARMQLTPVALGEAMALVDRLFGPVPGRAARTMSYDAIPTAVFTHPNVGTVGHTEAEARALFGHITVFKTDFKPLRHTLSGSTERTFMKLIVDTATDRVVGLHMVGAEAGEIIQGFAVAMKAGATKAVFDATIGIHPTAAEEFVTMRTPTAGN